MSRAFWPPRIRGLLTVCVLLGLARQTAFGQTAGLTQPLSPSVLGTFVGDGALMECVVLWRGPAGWFVKVAQRRASYGGDNKTINGDLFYGGAHLTFSYNRANRSIEVGPTTVRFEGDANTVLVEVVDGAARVIGTAHFASPPPAPDATFAQLLGHSPEIVSFLRCGDSSSDPRFDTAMRNYVCDDVSK